MVAIMKLKTISAFTIIIVIATCTTAAPTKNTASAMLRALSRTLPRAFTYTNKSSRYLPPNMPPGFYEQMQRDRRTGKLTKVKLADLQLQPPPANSAGVQKTNATETDAWQKPMSPPQPTTGTMSVSPGTSIPARPRYIERSTSEKAVPPTISHTSATPLNLPDAIKQSERQAQLAQTLLLNAAQGDAKSFNSLYKEAWNRNVWAQYRLGMCYERGICTKQNLAQAVEWYRLAAQTGLADAQFALAECYISGMGVEQNVAFAVEWYRKAAAQGFAEAQYALGTLYENGLGVGTDLTMAVAWYRKAAMQGLADAQFALGAYYARGLGGLEKSATMAVHWCTKAALQDSAGAQLALGVHYANGLGVNRDLSKAAEWFRKAAMQGVAYAQYMLGTYYANGLGGLEKNASMAALWYKKAAEQGLAFAQRALGDCYNNGFGVPKDASKALEWYDKASMQGLTQ